MTARGRYLGYIDMAIAARMHADNQALYGRTRLMLLIEAATNMALAKHLTRTENVLKVNA